MKYDKNGSVLSVVLLTVMAGMVLVTGFVSLAKNSSDSSLLLEQKIVGETKGMSIAGLLDIEGTLEVHELSPLTVVSSLPWANCRGTEELVFPETGTGEVVFASGDVSDREILLDYRYQSDTGWKDYARDSFVPWIDNDHHPSVFQYGLVSDEAVEHLNSGTMETVANTSYQLQNLNFPPGENFQSFYDRLIDEMGGINSSYNGYRISGSLSDIGNSSYPELIVYCSGGTVNLNTAILNHDDITVISSGDMNVEWRNTDSVRARVNLIVNGELRIGYYVNYGISSIPLIHNIVNRGLIYVSGNLLMDIRAQYTYDTTLTMCDALFENNGTVIAGKIQTNMFSTSRCRLLPSKDHIGGAGIASLPYPEWFPPVPCSYRKKERIFY